MRRARIHTQALTEHLASLCAENPTIDLRANAYGVGIEKCSQIARDAGFIAAVVSKDSSEGCVLSVTELSPTTVTQWWDNTALLSFEADIISLKRVGANTSVSYGYEYTTTAETTLALVGAGFSDGVPRTASPGAQMSVTGEMFPIAGRIAMDQCVLDVGDAALSVGDIATIWGANPSLVEWAAWSSRPTGALMSHLAPRVERQWS